jgi:hypothetical protein
MEGTLPLQKKGLWLTMQGDGTQKMMLVGIVVARTLSGIGRQ